VPYGHPLFGRLITCPDCGQDRAEAALARLSGLSPELRALSFARTVPLYPEVKAAAERLAADPRWFFTLAGPPGRGKTHILACLVNAGIAAGYASVYTTTAELLDHLRATFRPDAPVTFDALWERVMAARILALDEVDRMNATPFAVEKFFELVDVRYRHGADRLTAFATNSAVDDLPEYLVSRMRDKRSALFELAGVDVRQVRD
jgi:DNA replication protein DnaC